MLFLVKHSNSVCAAWSDTIEALNRLPNSAFDNYPATIMSYYRFDGRVNLFRTNSDNPENFLSLGIPTTEKDQTVAVTPVDKEKILSCIAQNKNVFFAYYTDIAISPPKAIEQSGYFYRDLATGNVYNFDNGELCTNMQFSIWYHAVALSSNLTYISVNPNLVAINSDIVGEDGTDTWYLLNNETSSIQDSLLNPKAIEGCWLPSNDVIVANSNLFELDIGGKSIFNGWGKTEGNSPKLTLQVQDNNGEVLPSPSTGTKYTFEINKPVGFIKVEAKTGTYLDTSTNSAICKTYLVINNAT